MSTSGRWLASVRIGICVAVVAFGGRVPMANAQRLQPRSIPASGIESYQLQSATMGRTYDVSIGLPTGYAANPVKQYPAIIVTDGNRMFQVAHGQTVGLTGPESSIEPVFVISVGTPFEEGDTAYVRRRVHEFSPPNWDMDDPFGRVVRSVCGTYGSPEGRCIGGAPAFLDFIVDELLPAVYAKYRIDRRRLGLFGVSAGGFFASYVVFQKKSPFKNYIISSPAMAYGDGEIYRLEQQYAADNKDLPAGIYLGSGSLEIDDGFLEGIGQIVSGHVRLSGLLRSRDYPGLRLFSEIQHGMGHSDMAAVSFARGLRLLYGK